MARGRMVSSSIRNSAKMAALSCDGARLLFLSLILSADNLGRVRGEPLQVKAEALPRNPASIAKVEAWIGELASVGLIHWYEHQGQRFIEVAGWFDHQRLSGNMSRDSDLPERTNDVRTPFIRSTNSVSPEVEVEVEVEGKEHTSRWREVFDRFWTDYPHFERRSSKAKARTLWLALKPQDESHLTAIRSHLHACKESHDWTRDGGSFVPAAEVWLRKKGWVP